jgi:1,4-alpha-glucan branching enzyme
MSYGSEYYGGSKLGNGSTNLMAESISLMNRHYSLNLKLLPLAVIVFSCD